MDKKQWKSLANILSLQECIFAIIASLVHDANYINCSIKYLVHMVANCNRLVTNSTWTKLLHYCIRNLKQLNMNNINTEPQVTEKDRTLSSLKNTKCSFVIPVGCIDEGTEESTSYKHSNTSLQHNNGNKKKDDSMQLLDPESLLRRNEDAILQPTTRAQFQLTPQRSKTQSTFTSVVAHNIHSKKN